jgi:hypothetical protein
MRYIIALPLLIGIGFALPAAVRAEREVISLDGQWQVTAAPIDHRPKQFDHRVAVPGLLDMAKPPFEGIGQQPHGPDSQTYWYHRTVDLPGPLPAVVLLKIGKAAYGTRVYVNDRFVGDHGPNFTAGLFNLKPYLNAPPARNELAIRVGAWRTSAGPEYPDGFDCEKVRYTPGIYDSVELILTGTPHVVRVQAVPDIEHQTVQAVVALCGDGPAAEVPLTVTVFTRNEHRQVGQVETKVALPSGGAEQTATVRVPIADCRLWSPEDPFLYELEVRTTGDRYSTQFGMRSFRFDRESGRALLNGKPYFLRGTNVCIFRFFEDPLRAERPWRENWVRQLFWAFRSMHWNSIRFSIGFPPELWYRIADELGLLVEDEFPIWYGREPQENWPPKLTRTELAREYTEWIQQRCNHPCVVIWDAQTATVTPETGKAIHAVRKLDLSNRPWDNGWGPPDDPADVFEAHPYLAKQPTFSLAILGKTSPDLGVPGGTWAGELQNSGHNPVIINEYDWLWLNRDGTPTTLSKEIYERFLGPNASGAQRRELHARLLAAQTEFWRSHRTAAGVLHFGGLASARPGGKTSDHFLDLDRLILEPNFRKYVRDAFAPVGLMLDFWDEEVGGGGMREVPVAVINDLTWRVRGSIHLSLVREGRTIHEQRLPCDIPPLGRTVVKFSCEIPPLAGTYQWLGELTVPNADPVLSVRDFSVVTQLSVGGK